MGDFNINLLKNKNKSSNDLIEMFHSFGLFSLINKPTRVVKNSFTLIDHIWSNCLDKLKNNFIIHTNISDHFPVFSLFDFNNYDKNHSSNRNFFSYRQFSDININNFKNDLELVTWDLVFSSSNADVAYDNFILIFKNIFDKNFPLIYKSVNVNHDNKPYINNNLKELIKQKNKIHKKYLKKPLTFCTQYKSIRNKLNLLIKQSKCKYYQDKLNNNYGNTKKTREVINEILNRSSTQKINNSFNINNNLIDDPLTVVQEFNNYYVNVGVNLAESIIDSTTSYVDYMGERTDNELVFNNISIDDVLLIVRNMKDSSAGYDDIPAKIVKIVINCIVEPLCHICNCSLSRGIFPSKLKIAKIIPIYKKDKKNCLENYRPISVLPVFSKIIEKAISLQLIEYLEHNNLLNQTQFGFRTGRSTVAAVLTLTDFILNSFDKNEFTIGIFIDLKKAFETVDHHILLQKLKYFGITNISFDLFNSYLSNRLQYVFYNDYSSEYKSVKYSVPQGSILGPILFILYVNDIHNCLHKLNNILFADDTCLFTSHESLNVLIQTVNEELSTFNEWLKANKLLLNVEKSSYIVFARRKKIPPDIPVIIINDSSLKRTFEINFLGINLTHNLSWNLHIKTLINKLNKIKGILYLVGQYLTRPSKVLIYYSLIYSNLIYGNILWGRAPNSILKGLVTCQKKIIRTVMNVNRSEHTHGLFVELEFLKINEINMFCTCIFVFKSLHLLTLPCDYYCFNNNNTYNLRNNNLLKFPFASSNQSQSSPKYYGCALWNSLPSEITSTNSLYTFKRKLKLYLLSLYNN